MFGPYDDPGLSALYATADDAPPPAEAIVDPVEATVAFILLANILVACWSLALWS